MKSSSFFAAMPMLVLAMAACESSTGLKGCDMPAQNASLISTAPFMTGVVTVASYEPPGYSPEGPIGPEILLHVTVDAAAGTSYPMQRVFVYGNSAVFSGSNSGTPHSTSACKLAVGDRVKVWVPSDETESVFGDIAGIDTTTFTWEVNQVAIVSGN